MPLSVQFDWNLFEGIFAIITYNDCFEFWFVLMVTDALAAMNSLLLFVISRIVYVFAIQICGVSDLFSRLLDFRSGISGTSCLPVVLFNESAAFRQFIRRRDRTLNRGISKMMYKFVEQNNDSLKRKYYITLIQPSNIGRGSITF